jgi:hypothetical protein
MPNAAGRNQSERKYRAKGREEHRTTRHSLGNGKRDKGFLKIGVNHGLEKNRIDSQGSISVLFAGGP